MVKICIDPGHSKGQNRSPVVPEYIEGERMFALGHLLKKELERYQDVQVLITREKVTDNPSLYERGNMAKGCEVLVSLHSDAADISKAGGKDVDRSTAFYPISGNGKDLAEKLTATVASTMGLKQGGKIKTRVNSAGNADCYGVIRHAVAAGSVGLIMEHGFHTNEAVCRWLLNDSNIGKLAKAEAKVLADYYGLKKKPGEEDEMRYNTLGDLKADKKFGDAYLPTVEKLMAKGILKGKGGDGDETILDLGEDAIRVMVILDRNGIFGE